MTQCLSRDFRHDNRILGPICVQSFLLTCLLIGAKRAAA
jgi:hypothetical protein